MLQKLRQAAGTVIKFVSLGYVSLSLFIWLFFWGQSPPASGITAGWYSWSIAAYYFFIILIISLLLTPFYFSKYLKYLIVVPKILFDAFLAADYFVFKIYRFHIDMLFIKMALSDFKGIGLSPLFSLIVLLVFLLITAINIYIFRKAEKIRIPYLKPLLWFFLVLFLSGQVIHIWANYYKQHFIEQYTPYFPYYFPTTSHGLMKKLEKKAPFLLPQPVESATEDLSLEASRQEALLNYPLHPLQFDDSLRTRPDILMIVLESWRADKLNPEVMPHLDSLANHARRYNNHYSTGNVTVSGLFGLMYGLHPTYLSYVQADASANQTLLTRSLKDLGYDIQAYTSSNLNRFSLKPMFFNRIDASHYHENLKDPAELADQKLIEKLIADLQSDSASPQFKFVFLTSSHHHYNYPPRFEKFKPVPANSEGFIFDKNIDPAPFVNDYQNALLYEDDLINRVINVLKSTGKIKHTLLVITGDHAEEFNDNRAGYWGHGSNFTLYQTQVPLIIYNPKDSLPAAYDFPTGHIDIVPTLLKDYLGCRNPVSDFSSGINLEAVKKNSRSFIQTSYKDKAYLIDSIVYSTGLMVKSYYVDDIKKKNTSYDIKRINALRKEESRFLK